MRRRRPRRHAALLALLVAMAGAVTGCGITADSAPRDIEPATAADNSETDGVSDQEGEVALGNGIVYLVDRTGDIDRLIGVRRDVTAAIDRDPTSVLDVLFAGPNALERANGITTVLPAGLRVLTANPRGGVVTVDLPAVLRQLTGEPLTLGLAQIVYTLAAVEGVTSVRITIEGVSASWPDAYGQLQTDPLTVYDYPGLVSSTQPEFPAVPSD